MNNQFFVAASFLCEVDAFFDVAMRLEHLEDCVSVKVGLVLGDKLAEVHLQYLELLLKFLLDLLLTSFSIASLVPLLEILDNYGVVCVFGLDSGYLR